MKHNRAGNAASARRLVSRRAMLNGGLALGTLAITTRRVQAQPAPHVHPNMPEIGVVARPSVPPTLQPLTEPQVRASAKGLLQTSLRAAYGYRDVGGFRLFVRGYEGGSPGPTLRMKPGDTLKIQLTNDMPPNPDLMPADISHPHQFNNTNFHFHGAHCSPSGIADNVMRSMRPGETYDIEIALPKDHPGGTYWYHPHH